MLGSAHCAFSLSTLIGNQGLCSEDFLVATLERSSCMTRVGCDWFSLVSLNLCQCLGLRSVYYLIYSERSCSMTRAACSFDSLSFWLTVRFSVVTCLNAEPRSVCVPACLLCHGSQGFCSAVLPAFVPERSLRMTRVESGWRSLVIP